MAQGRTHNEEKAMQRVVRCVRGIERREVVGNAIHRELNQAYAMLMKYGVVKPLMSASSSRRGRPVMNEN